MADQGKQGRGSPSVEAGEVALAVAIVAAIEGVATGPVVLAIIVAAFGLALLHLVAQMRGHVPAAAVATLQVQTSKLQEEEEVGVSAEKA